VELKDGSRVLIRPIGAGDRDALAGVFERLSPDSRYDRFFGPTPRLTDSQLTYLTDVDHHDHEALIAVEPGTGDGIGVARYVRTGDEVAEPAVAVADDWQGRGLAVVLLDELTDRAREEGISTFVAPVLARNRAAVAVLRRLGDTKVTSHGREVELEIALDERRGASPSLRRVLHEAAGQSVQPAVSFWHRLAGLRRPDVAERENVLVATAPATRRAHPPMRAAAALALVSGASVHLVATRRVVLDSDPEGVQDRLDEVAAELRRRGIEVETHLRRGDLAAVLLDVAVATRARLLIVDGTDAPHERLRGSTWAHVAHHAPCSVLVLRDRRSGA